MFKFDITIENLKRGISNPYQIFDELVLQHGYRIPSTIYNTQRDIGTNIYKKDWDLLIILDCCRVDALREVAPEYEFIEGVDSLKTVGGSTPEWTAKTFDPDYLDKIQQTGYVSGTAQLRSILEENRPSNSGLFDGHLAYSLLSHHDTVDISDLGYVDYAFEYNLPSDEIAKHPKGKTPPRYITDRGIRAAREEDVERLILHYMQPHGPYAADAIAEDRDLEKHEGRPLRYLRNTGDMDTVWEAYLNEIRFALDEVEIALNNIDAEKVIITADHGEAFGEYGIYGHTIGSLHPQVRHVPWVETTATDSNTYHPVIEEKNEADDSTEEILEALGYKT
jgi:hypothetical protein